MQFYLRVRSFDRKHCTEFAVSCMHSPLAMTLVIRAVYTLHQALLCDEFFVPSLNLLCESLVRICQRSGVYACHCTMDLLAAAVAACAVDDDHDVKLQLRHYWLGLPACAQGIPDDVAGATFMAAGASSPV